MGNDNQTRDFKGIWIPKEIWLSEELNLQEKCLLVEIDSLSSLGQCFASNEHFSKFLGLSKDRVSKMISGLKAKKFIEVTIIYKNRSKEIDKRIITTDGYRQKCLEGIGKNNEGYRQKCLEGIGKNNYTPIGKNAKDNNTVLNKTIINTSYKNNNSHSQKMEVKSKKKSVVAISPDTEILIENFKTIYKANLNPKHTQRLVDTKGIEVVKEYMSEFHDYIEGKNISDLGAYFYKCVMEEYTKPVSKKVTPTVPQYADFDQRHYEAEEFDKFYANMDD